MRQSRRPTWGAAAWPALLALLACGWAAAGASARSEPAPDRPPPLVTDGTVRAIASADGVTYIGGQFSHVGPRTGSGVTLTAQGERSPGAEVAGGDVLAAVADGSGGWYVGGTFTSVAGAPRRHLAHVLADGSVDPAFAPDPNGPVRALAAPAGTTTIYVGGSFSVIGGLADRPRLAAVDRATGAPLAWKPAPDGDVHALTTVTIETGAAPAIAVLAGGDFANVGVPAVAARGIAAVWGVGASGAGQTLASYSGTAGGGRVRALATGPPKVTATATDMTIYAGLTGVTSKALQAFRLNVPASGTPAMSVYTDLASMGGTINAVAVHGDRVFAGGEFSGFGTPARRNAAAYSTVADPAALFASMTLQPWLPDPDGPVSAIIASADRVLLGGGFDAVGGTSRLGLAAVSPSDGALEAAFDPRMTGGDVRALAAGGDALYAGGGFTSVGAEPRNGFAVIAADGTLSDLAPDIACAACSPDVHALVATPAAVYVGGHFDAVGGLPRANLAAIDPATGVPTAFAPDPDGAVLALSLQGGTLYAGGAFAEIAGQPRAHLAAFDAGGALAAWDPAADGNVHALAPGCGTVLAGGAFTTVGGEPRARLAALEAVSGQATAWNPTVNSAVYALARGPGVVYAGGLFTLVGDASRHRIAAVDAASGIATSWNPGADAAVRALLATPDHIYVGGSFDTIAGAARPRLAALQPATAAATAWQPAADGPVQALAPGGEQLLVGGGFHRIDGVNAQGFSALPAAAAGWTPDCPAPEPEADPVVTPVPTPVATAAAEPAPPPPEAEPTPAATPRPQPARPARPPRLALTRFAVSAARLVMPTRPVVLRLAVNRDARVRISFQRAVGGRWAAARVLRARVRAGTVEIPFAGRIGGRTLRPGLYRVRAVARAGAQRAAAPRAPVIRVMRSRAGS